MKNFYIGIGQSMVIMELISLCFAIFIYKKRKTNLPYHLLMGIIFFTVCIECTSLILYHGFGHNSRIWLYNIYNIVNYTLWFLIFYILLKGPFKKVPLIGGLLYLCTYIIEVWWIIDFRVNLQTIAHIVGSIILLIIVLIFYYQTLKSGKAENLKGNLFFWSSIGILLYYVVSVPYRIIQDHFNELGYVYNILSATKMVLGFLMYIFFVIGFIFFYKYNETGNTNHSTH